MKIRRIFKMTTAMVLACVTAIQSPAQTLASQPPKEYISEVRISSDKDWLENNKYKIKENDLNKGTGEAAVYLGYKTTNNVKDAIRDIAVMDMNGGYSYSNYESMLKEEKQKVSELTQNVIKMAKAFRQRYNEGSPAAESSFKYLNLFYDDDSKQTIGNAVITNNITEEHWNEILLQGNQTIVNAIVQYIARGCVDYSKQTWLQKLSDKGASEDAAKYDSDARKILEKWDDVQLPISFYQSSAVNIEDKNEVEKYMATLSDEKKIEFIKGMELDLQLRQYPYEDATLAEFFAREADDIDVDELYSLVSVLSAAQCSTGKVAGLSLLVLSSNAEEQAWNESDKEMQNLLKEENEEFTMESTISVYENIDRSYFEQGGIALTDAAMRKQASTGDSFFLFKYLKGWQYAVCGVVLAGAMVSAGIYLSGVIGSTTKAVTETVVTQTVRAIPKRALIVNRSTATVSIGTPYLVAAIGLALIAAGLYLTFKLYNYYNPDYLDIPKRMVDSVEGSDGKKYFVHYDVVKNQDGRPADVNVSEAKQWNALYTTKDKTAGEPILADFMVKTGDNKPENGYTGVHYFGEKAAYNLNNHCFNDKVNGIYLSYKRESAASVTGSAFSVGGIVAVAGISLVIGYFVGSLGDVILTKRRKRAHV